MCLILLAYRVHSDYPLLIAANRDEFHARPTASSHLWQLPDGILAGRDLEAGGTWLGVNSAGRFAAVTNVSENPGEGSWLSRGDLVRAFLRQESSATAFADGIVGERYRGFNLLLWDGRALVYASNRGNNQELSPGVYGVANAGLGEERFKVRRGTEALAAAIDGATDDAALSASLFSILTDSTPPATPERRRVPGTSENLPPAMGACFIIGAVYGTRASTVVTLNARSCSFSEQVYGPGGVLAGYSRHRLVNAPGDAPALDSSRADGADSVR